MLVHKRLQNLRQRDLDVSTYTQEFHNLTPRAKMYETDKKKLGRYVNGLKYSIQDELTLITLGLVHQCFNMALKIEEKHKRKGETSSRGRGNNNRGRGRFNGRGSFNKNQEESSGSNADGESTNRGTFRGRRPNGRGRSSGRGPSVFTGKCFTSNQVGNQSFRCPKKNKEGDRRIQLTQEEDSQSVTSYQSATSRLHFQSMVSL